MLSVNAGAADVEAVEAFAGHTLGRTTGGVGTGPRVAFGRRVLRFRNFGVADFLSRNVLVILFFVFVFICSFPQVLHFALLAHGNLQRAFIPTATQSLD